MRKISYAVILVVAAGLAFVVWWAYGKYFREEKPNFLRFTAEVGDIEETVRVRGEAVAQKEFDLEFPLSGTTQAIYVREGDDVAAGAPLLKLETTDLEIETKRLQAVLAQNEINLQKILAGATAEDIKVLETKAANAQVALDDARKNLVDKLQDGYIKTDETIKSKIDQFYTDAHGVSPKITFDVADPGLKSDAEWQKYLTEGTMSKWKESLVALTVQSDMGAYLKDASVNLQQIVRFLDKIVLTLNSAVVGSDLSQSTLNTYQTDVATARVNVNAAIGALTVAEEKMSLAESALFLARDELAFKKSGARSEDVAIANAQIDEVKNQILAVKEKIKKSTLYAPTAARIVKIWLETGEVFRPGETVISLSGLGDKIQADVSELEIGKIREGQEVTMRLDAFPGAEFFGKIVVVEPREIIKEGDKYYRINVDFEKKQTTIRSGMSADLTIKIDSRKNVLKIPEIAVFRRDGESFVLAREGDANKEIAVKTGVSDGEFVEITNGLSAGQIVVVLAD